MFYASVTMLRLQGEGHSCHHSPALAALDVWTVTRVERQLTSRWCTQAAGNPVAKTVAELHLERNSAVLLLRNELDLLSDSDEEGAPLPPPTRVRPNRIAL